MPSAKVTALNFWRSALVCASLDSDGELLLVIGAGAGG
jgi:hypothetical protein